MTVHSPLDQPEESPVPTPPSEEPVPALSSSTASASAAAAADASPAPNKIPLAIEPPKNDSALTREIEGVQSLDLGEGVVIKLDKLGPMIVNSDGTLSRIQNWQDLHPIEQERTVRLLVKKRNLVRMAKIDAESGGANGEEKVTALKEAEADAKPFSGTDTADEKPAQ